MSLKIHMVKNLRDLAEFVAMPGRIPEYRKLKGLDPDSPANYDPSSNPVQRHLKTVCFLAYRDGLPAGRIAAIKDFLNPDKETGFFGCFECVDDAGVSSSLVDAAFQWLLRSGCSKMIGPATFNTNQKVGLLVEGRHRSPQPMLPHNPPYYGPLLEKSGLVKHTDLLTLTWRKEMGLPEKIAGAAAKFKSGSDAVIRRINPFNIRFEAPLVRDLFNGSMSANWGYIPLTLEESAAMLNYCSMFADPDLIITLWYKGQPAGITIFLPTENTGRTPSKTVRAAILGVLPQYRHRGLDSFMIDYLITTMMIKGYESADISMIHEGNTAMLKIVTKVIGAELSGRYRVYGTA